MNNPSFPLSERPAADQAAFTEVKVSELEVIDGGFQLTLSAPTVTDPDGYPGCGTGLGHGIPLPRPKI
jgi:hypothetical protein